MFIDWYERGFIHKFGDMWGLSGDDIVKDNVNKARKRRPNAEQLIQMINSRNYDSPWEAFGEKLEQVTEEVMSDFNLDPLYRDIVWDYMFDVPDAIYKTEYEIQEDIDRLMARKSSKKNVKKDGGAMGCGCAGASNTVYGSNPQRNRKKRSKKKTTKDAYDETFNPSVGKRVIK